jgi:hypothetical protein
MLDVKNLKAEIKKSLGGLNNILDTSRKSNFKTGQ